MPGSLLSFPSILTQLELNTVDRVLSTLTQKGQIASLRSWTRTMVSGFKPGQSHQRTSKKGCSRSAPALPRLTDDQSYKCNPRQTDEMHPPSLFSFFPALLLFFQSMISLCWPHCPEICSNLPAVASRVLRLQVRVTMPGSINCL